MVGSLGVGKTSISTRMETGTFNLMVESTIGCFFHSFKVGDLGFEIWDTAGQERYKTVGPIYYRKARIIIFVFDVTDPRSIEGMTYYIDYFHKNIDTTSEPVKFIIVGNKVDKFHDHREYIEEILRTNPIIIEYQLQELKPLYVSALNGYGIEELIDHIVDLGHKIRFPRSVSTVELKPLPDGEVVETGCSC